MIPLKDEIVTLKGQKDSITINIQPDAEFEQIMEAMEDKLISSLSFFKNSSINVNFKGKELTEDEEKNLIEYISTNVECSITRCTEEPVEPSSSKKADVPNVTKEKLDKRNICLEDTLSTKIYKKTVRSGQLIQGEGNLVIVGDVNPGAEVSAKGDIIVMGILKGIVHAGNEGDRNAVVVALRLVPTQLRIADIITRSPEGECDTVLTPEIAYIKENQIFIEQYLQKKK